MAGKSPVLKIERKARSLTGKGFLRGTVARVWLLIAALPPVVVACGNSSTSSTESNDGSLRGELRIFRLTYEDGRAERIFYLAANPDAPATTRLLFAADPELDPWTRLKVWGVESPEGLQVTHHEIDTDADVGRLAQPIVNPAPRTRTAGVVLIDTGGGVALTPADATTAVFGIRGATQPGLHQYYNEVSYGELTITGEVLGPFTASIGSCDNNTVTQLANGWAGKTGKTFNHWLNYFGKGNGCGWGGLGEEGTASRPAKNTWYNNSFSCVVLNQEVGHNFGMMHSGSLTCSGASFADDPLTCKGSEYGSRNTVMGGGCGHLNAYEKWYEGFLKQCNGVKVGVSGEYRLFPTEKPCNGIQALQIPMPKMRNFKNSSGVTSTVGLKNYFLEFRTKTGMHANLSAPQVVVTVGEDVTVNTKSTRFTWNLDMNPSTTNAAEGMMNGAKFDDPAGGLSFAVTIDPSNAFATVNVTMANGSGSSTCIDGTMVTAPGPTECGAPPDGTGGMPGTGGAGGTGGGGGGGVAGGNSKGGASGGGGRSGGAGGGGGRASGGMAGSAGAAGFSSGGAGGAGGAPAAGGMITSGGATSGGATSGGATSGGATSGGATSGGATTTSGGAASGGAPPMAGAAGVGVSDPGTGCGCRTTPTNSSGSAWAALALLATGAAIRRRNARPKPKARGHSGNSA